jgi:NADPH:quinone reductase-like Zn-dependent oxidoreductase
VTAAAIINPGVGAWLAPTRQAALLPGETALVPGATGASGRGAGSADGRRPVIAAGRNQAIVDQLGATVTVTLGGPDDQAALARAAGQDGIHVVIDYRWASPPRRRSRPSPAPA